MKTTKIFALLSLLLLCSCGKTTETETDVLIVPNGVLAGENGLEKPYNGSIYDIDDGIFFTDSSSQETIEIQTTEDDWYLTGKFGVDTYTYSESSSYIELLTSYTYNCYDRSDTENAPYPRTNFNPAATYSSFTGSEADNEITSVMLSSLMTVTKSDANTLSLYIYPLCYPLRTRLVFAEVMCGDGTTKNITISQFGDTKLMYEGAYLDPVGIDTTYVVFDKDGGSYTIDTRSTKWSFPDLTCCVDTKTYLYDTKGYDDQVRDAVGYYPSSSYIEDSYSSSCIYNSTDGTTIEQINGDYFTLKRVDGANGYDISVEVSPNDSGEWRYIFLNVIPTSSTTDRTIVCISQNG